MESSRSFRAVAGAILLIVTFVPRAFDLDRAFTIDERLWIDRSDRFIDNVSGANFSAAYETGHPGVTVMWIGGLAQRTLPEDATLRERYARARLGMAVVAALLIVLVAGLLAALAGMSAGLIGGMLLALDPFLLAHNRVLHMDGLLALLMAASFLALLRAVRDDSRRWLIGSGALAGLAFLTKQPSVLLLPAAIVVLHRDGRGIARRLTTWMLPAAGVVILAWPVLWVNPLKPIGLMLGSAARGASDSHSEGFFLGRAVTRSGPLFYPVAFLFRTSILTLPAAIATAVWAIRRRKLEGRLAFVLLAFALAFFVMMSLGLKKGDRYILPAMALVDLAIAIGAARLLAGRARVLATTAAAAGMALHALPVLALHPYEETHYNRLAGGPQAAEWALVVGWGEGLDEAAEALNRLPNAENLTVAGSRVTQFQEFFRGRTVRLEKSALTQPDGEPADLVLFYLSSVQTERFDEVWRRYRKRTPIYRLDVNGLPLVRVYRVSDA